jgi:hypothetical protein
VDHRFFDWSRAAPGVCYTSGMRARLLGFVLLLGGAAACSAQSSAPKAPEAAPAAESQPAAAPATAAPDSVRSEADAPARRAVSSSDPSVDLAAIAAAEAQIAALAPADKKKGEATRAGGAAPRAASPESGAAPSCASDHLCSLTGEGDARCSDARTRTKNAEGRVKGACTC